MIGSWQIESWCKYVKTDFGNQFVKEVSIANVERRKHSELISSKQLIAAERFGNIKPPTLRDENWRFTDLSPIYETEFSSPTNSDVDEVSIKKFFLPEPENRLVFINGAYSEKFSEISNKQVGIFLGNLERCPKNCASILQKSFAVGDECVDFFFPTMNTAMTNDLAVVMVESNTKVENPIHLLHISTGERNLSNHRVFLNLGEGSSANILEEYVSVDANKNFTNVVTEVSLATSANLEHLKIQRENTTCFNIGFTHVQQEKNSEYQYCGISTGGHVDRQDMVISQMGKGTQCSLDGLTFLSGNQTGGFYSKIVHDLGEGISKQLHKTIVGGKARSVFNGQIYVKPDGHLSNASQSNKNLLLSSKGRIDTKPQLEIFADDVKCSHGATVGQLNDEEIFYLRSRGLSDADARKILIFGFASEIISLISIESLASLMRNEILEQTGNENLL